ncbi:ABC transporter substrate-binding protein [Paenibacillus sp. 1011MAR3C5]|uniref:ABC transporter substrate-binding protein n=1 Tax=Paenibacillus sp. 1011MAR3C5 TaxID=1675787 RepID=UPI0015FF38E5|nr:ABC transporter substrate-binding protein [Paenibacillus sp. 1011MAR3C5]
MKIRRHYFILREAYPQATDGVPLQVTTAELAEKLDCTHRNMVLLLKRMVQEEWIEWTARRGRGNRSLLTFAKPLDSLMLEEAEELAMRGDLQSALELLQPRGAALVGRFQQWLSGQFGFQTIVEGERRTDTLRFPMPSTIDSLDPARIHYVGESHLVNQLFDGLVRMDVRGDTVLPHLAHAWETNEARTEWTFFLRKGIFFHHGREMTSSDVKYTLRRLHRLAPNGLYSWVYNGIEQMDTPDDLTIRFRLKTRNEAFLSFLSTNRASIVPEDLCEQAGDSFGQASGAVVGTGPFRLAGSSHGIWILEAFPSYFQERPFLDRVEVWTMPPGADRKEEDMEELRQFQVMHNVRIEGMAGGEWEQVRQSGTTCKFLTINELKNGPLANAAFRSALDYAIHRTELLRRLSGDVIEPAASFWSRPAAEGTQGDIEDAGFRHSCSDMLRECGYTGEPLTLTTIPQYEHDAALIQEMLGKAGINLHIHLIAAEQFKGKERMTADLLLFAIMLDEHRELRLIDLYKSMMQHMDQRTSDVLGDALQLILGEPDASARMSLFMKIEDELIKRHSLLFLYRKHLKTAFHPSVQGISLESLGWVRFRDLWFR